jgi:mlo protein
VPETTLLCFELLFLRTHNIQSHKFDFATYVLECIEANSSEMLGMSPGRWLIATVGLYKSTHSLKVPGFNP